jgi:hypothetical protein
MDKKFKGYIELDKKMFEKESKTWIKLGEKVNKMIDKLHRQGKI